MTHAFFLATLIPLALAGCSDPPGQYRASPREVADKLFASDLTPLKMHRHCGVLIHFKAERNGPDTVIWRLTSSGRELAYFIAKAVAVDAKRTRVDLEIGPKEWNGAEPYSRGLFYRRPGLNQPIRPNFMEHIDATLTGRPYDLLAHNGIGDSVCNVQNSGLKTGLVFSVNDTGAAETVRAIPQD